MQVIQGIDSYVAGEKPCYLALGNFDGVHIGHQKLLKEAVAAAVKNNGISAVFMFDPHPSRVLNPNNHALQLMNNESKSRIMERLGIDVVVYSPFTLEIAGWSPETFVKEVLIGVFQVNEVFVGFNHTFGHRGQGNSDTMKNLGQIHGFDVSVIPRVEIDNVVVSSSAVRQRLMGGDIQSARQMLGYYPFLEGEVIHGDDRGGRKLGFPTANINIGSDCAYPGSGVYAAKTLIRGQLYDSVVNIGIRPTFYEEGIISIESHILDFDNDLYGEHIRIYFIDKIRDERRFNGVDQLIAQIERDRNTGREMAAKTIIEPW